MKHIISNLLEISIYSGFAVLFVLGMRLLFKKASKAVICNMWLLVGLRLMIFIPIETEIALIPRINTYAIIYGSKPEVTTVSVLTSDTIANENQSVYVILAVIWLTGAAFFLMRAIISSNKLRKNVKNAILLSGYGNVYLTDRVENALVLGIFKPKIYINSRIEEDKREYVLLHERMHIRRGDHVLRLLSYILLSVFWFVPWIWISYILYGRDMELACDEAVIKDMDSEQKACYAETLAGCIHSFRINRTGVVSIGKIGIKERIRSISCYEKRSGWISTLAVVMIITGLLIFMMVRPPLSYAQGDENIQEKSVQESEEICLPPLLMFEDKLYITAPYRVSQLADSDYEQVIGIVTSYSNSASIIPKINNQSNCDVVGCSICKSSKYPELIFINHNGFYMPFKELE